MRRETHDLKEVVAEQALELRLLKKSMIADGGDEVRYPTCQKLKIIRIVEQSYLPARRTLERLGIPRTSFHRWYDRFLEGWRGRPPRPPAATEMGLEPYPRGYTGPASSTLR